MRDWNVLVTGCNGFIGKTFVERLRGTCRLYGLDTMAPEAGDKHFKKFYVQDLKVPFQLSENFDCVFHLAALNLTHVGKAGYSAYDEVNVKGTQNLIKAVQTKKFIFMSTAKVYKQEGKPIDESAKIEPLHDYEKSKWEAEKVCSTLVPSEQLLILRPVNIVGARQAEKAVLPVFFKNAILNNPLEMIVDPKTTLQFLSVKDIVDCFQQILERTNVHGILNLSSIDSISLEKLISDIIKMTGSQSQVRFLGPVVEKASFSPVISQKAKMALGWEAKISIESILEEFCHFYKENLSILKDG
ncbi:MAG: NAD(P)-dependent oxidoreductase [Candidatus Omnitrophica bacterium]|nr:NAD(P)-dependent oxidoreductase [Candidatus Omnitrophota bacterium]